MEDADERREDPPDALGPTLRGGDPTATYIRTAAIESEPAPIESGPLEQRYAIAGELGRGGMGLVLSARDRRLGRTVAIKALLPEHATDEIVRRRFTVEAQVGAQLEHPNIVPVYGMEESAEGLAFTMRLLEGRTLRAYISNCKAAIARGGPLTEEHALPERLERFLKVCDAVAYAHSRGVIHRDIKPDNVVLGGHGEVYLVDWGIAKVLTEEDPIEPVDEGFATRSTVPPDPIPSSDGVSIDQSGTTTRHGETIGSPAYMPPEQALGQLEQHGPASDQFGLGMVLHELITLALPREGGAMQQILAACRGEMRSIERTAEGTPTPPGLIAIVRRATALEPADRYASVEDFAADVRRFVRGEELSVHRDSFTRRAWKRLSRRPGVVLGVILGVVVVALAATSVSFSQTIEAQRRAAREARRLSALTGVVVGRSEAIDQRFADARALVEGLAATTSALLRQPSPDPPPPLAFGVAGRLVDSDGPRLEGLHPVARYGMDVSFETPLYLYPPRVTHDEVARTLAVMGPLVDRFRSVLLSSLDPAAPSWSRVRQDVALDAGRTPLHVTYVGFESGLLLNYPGYVPFPDDYDPRRRPWYREARERYGTHFGRPYPDASGSAILVPCNRAVRDTEGRLLAVAGADMALDDLARAMRIDEPGWIRSSLVDAQGRQILDTEQAGLRLGVTLYGDAPLEARPIDAETRRAIRRVGTGFVHRGGELIVFDRVETIGWTFVVHLDATRALEER